MPGVTRGPGRRGNRFEVPIGEAPADEHAAWERLAPRIAADLASLAQPHIQVRVLPDDIDPASTHLEVSHPYGAVVPIFVEIGEDEEEAIVEAMAALLESGLFDDRFDPWPRCPIHPATTHSLKPIRRQRGGVWECPEERVVISRIGWLGPTSE